MPEQKKNQLRKRKILFLMSYREKMEKKIPQGKKTVVMQSLLDDKGNVLRVSYIYLSDTMEIWFDQSSRSNREENRKAEINPCFIACK